jgi:hypothetical protein
MDQYLGIFSILYVILCDRTDDLIIGDLVIAFLPVIKLLWIKVISVIIARLSKKQVIHPVFVFFIFLWPRNILVF